VRLRGDLTGCDVDPGDFGDFGDVDEEMVDI
jgi:hypothetical protein